VLTRGVEAEKVEKVADARYQTGVQLFSRKRGPGMGPNRYPRGFYMPQ